LKDDHENVPRNEEKEVQFELPNLDPHKSDVGKQQPGKNQAKNQTGNGQGQKRGPKGPPNYSATKPLNQRTYRPPLPVTSKTFREQIATDRETFSQKSDNFKPVTLVDTDNQSALPMRPVPGLTVSEWSQQPPPTTQTGVFRKANTHVDNYINIQNESESNWNFRTKSEAFRPSYAVSIDPEKMNIRGYLDRNRKSTRTVSDSPIMEVVERLLTSKVINILIELPMPSHRSHHQRRSAPTAHLTADERMYQRPVPPQFMSHAQNCRLESPNSPLPATSEKPDDTGNDWHQESAVSDSSFQEITPTKNVFSKQELESKKSRFDKKSWVSSNLSFGFMKGKK
jgi:hypothetical protein